jgi:hypothetical protein
MARKKAKKSAPKRRTSRRSGKISGINTGTLMQLAAGGAGFIAASFLDKLIPVDNNLVKQGAKLAIAVFLPNYIKGPNGQAIAIGMGANAVQGLAKQFLPGIAGDDELVYLQGINELGEMSTIEGINQLGEAQTISGLPLEVVAEM